MILQTSTIGTIVRRGRALKVLRHRNVEVPRVKDGRRPSVPGSRSPSPVLNLLDNDVDQRVETTGVADAAPIPARRLKSTASSVSTESSLYADRPATTKSPSAVPIGSTAIAMDVSCWRPTNNPLATPPRSCPQRDALVECTGADRPSSHNTHLTAFCYSSPPTRCPLYHTTEKTEGKDYPGYHITSVE
uniref:Uncharacterized protein n=1 Tax=Mycena chlorophos TaxID=658473 RepID=A0ABQ0LDL7_MYCCL|nr:predicted protein [Mycena chlorophos]